LRRARKATARAAATKDAAENRVQFGLSRAQRDVARAAQAADARGLDAHKRERTDAPAEGDGA
jgi:hypothetical protein